MTKTEPRSGLIPDGIPFTQFPNDAITDPALDHHALRVLLYLFMRANSAHRTWPSQRTISKDIGMGRNKVIDSLTALEEEGWISITLAGKSPDAPIEHKQRHAYTVHGTRPHRLFEPQPVPSENRRAPDTGISGDTTGTEREPEPVSSARHNKTQVQHTEQDPVLSTTRKPRNSGWDFYTNPEGFNLPTGTKPQTVRVGRLAREINATLDHNNTPDDLRPDVLARAALSWPLHFPDATLTPDAFAKHLPALLKPPLRGNRHQVKQATRAVDDEALINQLGKALP